MAFRRSLAYGALSTIRTLNTTATFVSLGPERPGQDLLEFGPIFGLGDVTFHAQELGPFDRIPVNHRADDDDAHAGIGFLKFGQHLKAVLARQDEIQRD